MNDETGAERDTIAWRVRTLEHERDRDRTEFAKRLAEQQVTYDAAMQQVREQMRQDYLTAEQTENRFLSKRDAQRMGTVRREWLILILAVPGWAAAILQALGHH